MTGSQMFVLIFLLGGALALGFLFMGLGVYYRGKNAGKSRADDER